MTETREKVSPEMLEKAKTEGVVQRKPSGAWGIISIQAGEWWLADYDSKEAADAALKAYHAQRKGFDSLSDLKSQLFDAPSSVKESFNDIVEYFGLRDWVDKKRTEAAKAKYKKDLGKLKAREDKAKEEYDKVYEKEQPNIDRANERIARAKERLQMIKDRIAMTKAQLKTYDNMDKLEMMDSLIQVKEELFDAPSDVKLAFNSLIEYFDGKGKGKLSPETRKKLEEVNARMNETSSKGYYELKDIIEQEKLESGKSSEGWRYIPSDYIVVESQRWELPNFDGRSKHETIWKSKDGFGSSGKFHPNEWVTKYEYEGKPIYTRTDTIGSDICIPKSFISKLKMISAGKGKRS